MRDVRERDDRHRERENGVRRAERDVEVVDDREMRRDSGHRERDGGGVRGRTESLRDAREKERDVPLSRQVSTSEGPAEHALRASQERGSRHEKAEAGGWEEEAGTGGGWFIGGDGYQAEDWAHRERDGRGREYEREREARGGATRSERDPVRGREDAAYLVDARDVDRCVLGVSVRCNGCGCVHIYVERPW